MWIVLFSVVNPFDDNVRLLFQHRSTDDQNRVQRKSVLQPAIQAVASMY